MKILLDGKIFFNFERNFYFVNFSIFEFLRILERFLGSFYTIYKLWNNFEKYSEKTLAEVIFRVVKKDHKNYLKINPCVCCEREDNC